MAALTVDFRKHSGPTPADDMAAQIITDCGNFTLDFKQQRLCASPLFLQTLGPWFQIKCKTYFHLKRGLAVIPVVGDIFLPNVFLPVNFAFNMLWYSKICTTHWTATPFSNEALWLTLFVEVVNDRLLDHCLVTSVPHYCGFKEQEIPTIYTVWMVIYWNSNVNILIFWDTEFWLSLAVSSNHKNVNKKNFWSVLLYI